MKVALHQAVRLGCLALALVVANAHAGTFGVTITIGPSLSASNAFLAFDLLDGGSQNSLNNNSVEITSLTSDGARTSTSSIGGVTPNGTGGWFIADTEFFNELLVGFGPLGTQLSFSVTPSNNVEDPPDRFAFFILGEDQSQSLFPTTEPLGSDALFAFDLGKGGVEIYGPVEGDEGMFAVRITQAVPEPATVALVATAMLLMAMHRRRRAKGLRPLR